MTKKQITNIEVKKNNRNRIFRYIRKAGVVSNPDIAYHLQMSLPTVTQNTKEFLERGLLQEVGELASTGGRRAKALKVCADFRLAAGMDIIGNHVSMLLVNLQGEILDCQIFAKPYEKGMAYYQELAQNLERFLDKNQVDRTRFLGLGISFPGIVNFEKKAITYSHVLGVEWLPLEEVSACFPYACFFLNDANAGAYAEGLQADRGEEFFYLSLSNTVGGAVFAHGELSQGKNFRCGEAGHMTLVPDGGLCYCGKKGCLDVYCSAKGWLIRKRETWRHSFLL
ncbi:MAG: ROK family protein [Blautia hansenii]